MPPIPSSAPNGVHFIPEETRKFTNGTRKVLNGTDTNTSNGCANGVQGWNIAASDRAIDTVNPIRHWVQELFVIPNPDKDVIKLSMGDPTLYGNLRVNSRYIDEYCRIIRSGEYNGYTHSMGLPQARQAVADRYSLTADDVVLTSGASGALELAIGSIANRGDNILVPRPGFGAFKALTSGFGISVRYYDLLPEQQWEVDVNNISELVDDRTRAIVVNNPCNPTGSVYSRAHIREVLGIAFQHRLPVIADEIYADMAFAPREFVSIASQSTHVPVLSVGGISKQFVVPGWRLGWLCMHDRHDILKRGGVRLGIKRFSTRMIGPSCPVQAVLPSMLRDLRNDSSDSNSDLMKTLRHNANFTVRYLGNVRGLKCIAPQGGMFTMVKVDTKLLRFVDDMDFTKRLLVEEAVFVLPGSCFQAPNFIRICFCAPEHILRKAFDRIEAFSKRHANYTN